MDGLIKSLGIIGIDDVIILIEQIAPAVALVNCAEDPAMAVEVGKLGVLVVFVELLGPDLLEEIDIRPATARSSAFGIARANIVVFVLAGVVLLFVVQLLAVNFVVPPGI